MENNVLALWFVVPIHKSNPGIYHLIHLYNSLSYLLSILYSAFSSPPSFALYSPLYLLCSLFSHCGSLLSFYLYLFSFLILLCQSYFQQKKSTQIFTQNTLLVFLLTVQKIKGVFDDAFDLSTGSEEIILGKHASILQNIVEIRQKVLVYYKYKFIWAHLGLVWSSI